MNAFKVLELTNMYNKLDWHVGEYNSCRFFVLIMQQDFHSKTLLSLIASTTIKQLFFAFELQATLDWG